MDLTLDQPGDHLFVRAISERGIRVIDDWYRGPLLISADTLVTEWPVPSFEHLSETQLEPIFALQPDVVLLGTGARQRFLPATLLVAFFDHGIGIETMTTRSACRTFNILVAERRRVVAALMPLDA